MRLTKRLWVSFAAAMLVALSVSPGIALAADVQHGIGFTKGCTSPVKIGDPYACSYTVRNVLDEAEDTLTINSLSDTVHAASGNVASGNIFGAVQMTVANGATCTGGTGSGTAADPYTGVTSCTLPFTGRVNILSFTHYTVQPADFGLPGHQLTDDASLGWHDLCNDPAGTNNSNCNANPPAVGAAGTATVQQLVSSTRTDIHDPGHNIVTAVAVGTTVHDFVKVTGQPGNPPPSGNVTIQWFSGTLGSECTTVLATSGPIALNAAGEVDATAFNFTPTSAGFRGFRASYAGDATYLPSAGVCEPLRVVDARITIAPNATNRINTPHTFTATVFVNDGTGEVLAPVNTHVTFTTVDANGATSLPNPPTACDTIGATGQCTTTITSSTTGTSTVTAHTTVNVAGVSVTRATDTTHGSSGPAVKTWVNAIITISPNAFNEVNQPHTFVATVLQDVGDGTGFHAVGAGVPITITLTPDATACPVPTGPFNLSTNVSGQVGVTFTSACAGTVTAHASSTLSVAGSASFTIQTDSQGGNSGDATKVFQDAKISITPNGSNAVDSNHTFVATVMVDLGQGGGFVPAPDGTQVTFTSVDSNGATSTPNPPTSCVTVGGSCPTTITSPTTGTTVVSAHVTFTTPAGVTLTRHTDGTHGSSGPATKIWRDAFIQITPQNATNAVGTNHVLTITVTATNGGILADGTATASIVTPPSTTGGFVGPASCNYTGGGSTASCTVTITSAASGLTQVHATSNIGFTNALGTVTRATGTAGNVTHGCTVNCDDATKHWVDAYIQITPQNATNPLPGTHVLTITVTATNGGILAGGTANATILPSSTTGSFSGPSSCTYAGGAATATCTVTITSAVAGVTNVQASSTISFSNATGSVSRTTGTAANVAAGCPSNCDNAAKLWIRTDVHDSSHNVITTIAAPATVHDNFQAAPGVVGTVTFTLYDTNNCSGAPDPNVPPETVPLTAASNGVVESTPVTLNPPSDQDYSYRAHYTQTTGAFPSADASCEPFKVTNTPNLPCPAGSFVTSISANGDLNIKYDQFPAPNDNSYGVNAVGWGTKGHTFGNLVGSDHAGFQLVDPNGVVKLDFAIDTISAKTGTPSGYASLGPFGGDGGINVGTLTPADITWDHSIARNLNNTGYFAGGVQVVGKPGTAGCPAANSAGCVDLLVDSPKTLNTVDSYVLTPDAAAVFNAPNPDSADSPGWNFHNTFFVTIKASKLAAIGFNAATWKVQPNDDELHNSPAKPCPCPTNAVDPNPTVTVVPNANGTTTITYAQSLAVNDNSYGTGTDATWGSKSHTFSNLLGSDKLEVVITQGGVKKYDFTLDYISQATVTPSTPSGYDSLGPTGGDGSISVGTVGASGVQSWTTSLDQDMNVNCPPPAGPWTTNSPTSPAKPECAAWDFVNSYTVTVNGTFSASDVTFPLVHNSPAKPVTCPSTGGGSCNLAVTKTEVKDKQLKVTIKNSGTSDSILTAINNFKWPSATNGKLLEIKLDGDSIYKPAGGVAGPGPINITTAQLVADPNKRKINKGSSDTLVFIFEKNASTNLSLYSGATADFGANCTVSILP